MKKYIQYFAILLCVVATYTIQAQTLEFTIYNNSQTKTYKVYIKSAHNITSTKWRHDQATVILKPGESSKYSRKHFNKVVALEYIKVTDVADETKFAEFKRKRDDYYRAKKSNHYRQP